MRALIFVTMICLVPLVPSQSIAGAQEDADYVAEQLVTREVFEASIQAQRRLIQPPLLSAMEERGIEFNDPDLFFDIYVDEFIDEFTDLMRRDVARLYVATFSEADLTAIARFYATPAGQALAKAAPDMVTEIAQLGRLAGSQAGRNAGPRVARRLETEDIVLESKSLTRRLIDFLR